MRDRTQKRALALVLATAAMFAAAAPAAVADNSDQQVVATVYPGGTQESVSLAQLESGDCPTYAGDTPTQLGPGGQTPETIPSPTEVWPLSSVLGCMQPTPIEPAQITSVVVINSQGSAETGPGSVLGGGATAPNDLSIPSDFLDSTESPLIFSNGTYINYLRPQRTPTDQNDGDAVTGDQIVLEVFEQPALPISITPSSTSVAAGQRVSFTVSGVNASDQASYSWNFDGGATNSTSATPSLIFPAAGVYAVTLTVTDSTAGSVGVATTTITVGNTTPTQTSTTPRKVGPTHGKQGGSVGAPAKSKPAPTKSATPAPSVPKPTHTTPARATPTPTRTTPARTTPVPTTPTRTTPSHTTPGPVAAAPGSARTGAATSSGATAGSAGATGGTSTPATTTRQTTPTTTRTATTPTPTTPTTTRTTTTTTRTTTTTTTTTTTEQHKPKPKPTHQPQSPAPRPSTPHGQRVDGQLLASLTPVPARASTLVHTVTRSSPVGAAALSGIPGKSPWAAIAGGSAAVLLLALGAGRELSARGRGRRRD